MYFSKAGSLFLLSLTLASPAVMADTDSDGDGVIDSIDVDDDNDGLIELHSLAELNMMRFDPHGNGLRQDAEAERNSTGCAYTDESAGVNEWCMGYELVVDVDFDTNGNGEIDQGDEFCNYSEERGVCEGWLPVSYGAVFQTEFNGNGHTIRNLYIDRPGDTWTGFFYQNDIRNISDVVFTGPLTSVTGGVRTGIVTGSVSDGSVISGVVVEGTVIATGNGSTGNAYAGGIAGLIHRATIRDSIVNVDVISNSLGDGIGYSGGVIPTSSAYTLIDSVVVTGTVQGDKAGGVAGYLRYFGNIHNTVSAASVTGATSAGGIAGLVEYSTEIGSSLAVGSVNGTTPETETGGLVGEFDLSTWSPIELPHNYWATDTTGQYQLHGSDLSGIDRAQILIVSSSYGATLNQLECPTHASAAYCALRTRLYLYWDESLWDFGTSDQLPGLNLAGTVYRPVQTMDGSFDIVED
ncbi:MAG: hypothetical protein CMI00_00260 [Oceanospirillaceae bacterium]|nr:hypothetical protein [Oceanospirillaceae bacterium]|tara:strand:+ start:19191 stop:20585 length:1395 start_codon:yes stop_codon:yes gene_type:complete